MAIPSFLFAQDTIFTKKGDTICCKITNINRLTIHFRANIDHQTKDSTLSMREVSEYSCKHPLEDNKPKYKYPKLRIAFNMGKSYRTKELQEDMPDELIDYYNTLYTGDHFGGDLQYFIIQNFGFGLKYSHFGSSSQVKVPYTDDWGNLAFYNLQEDIDIDFIGPTLNIRNLHNKNRNSLMGYLGVGYLHFTDQVLSHGIDATGKTLGLATGLAYDFKIFKYAAIGIDISYILGTLTKYDLSYGNYLWESDLSENNDLHHMNISVGLRLIY